MRNCLPAALPVLLCCSACATAPLPPAATRSAGDVLAAAALAAADSLHTAPLAPGVTHLRAWFNEGPWAVHVVEIDTARCRPQWQARKPAGTLDTRATTSALAGDALVAINADFFQLPGGTPVGAQVRDGVPLIGPSDRAAWLWDGRAMYAGPSLLRGLAWTVADTVALVQVNRAARSTSAYSPPTQGVALFTPRVRRVPPAEMDADVVWIRLHEGDERAGRGVVVRVERAQRDTLTLQEGMAVVQAYGRAREWAARRTAGEVIEWRGAVQPRGGEQLNALEAVGGFPLLLRDGRDVLAETPTVESFGPRRHPRSALGWSSISGRVFLVLVDGRQAPYSDGMTLAELVRLFQRLGATDALNLDGGGSSALVLRGRLANRPSDSQGERAVGNALVLAGCR